MNFYELLNVSRDASDEEIKLAFSQLLAQYSRDAANGSGEAEKKISDLKYAKKTLTDPLLRAEYDKALAADESMNKASVDLRKAPRVSLTKPEQTGEIYLEPAEKPQKPQPPEPAEETAHTEPEQSASSGQESRVSAKTYLITNAIALAVFIVLIIVVSNSV